MGGWFEVVVLLVDFDWVLVLIEDCEWLWVMVSGVDFLSVDEK